MYEEERNVLDEEIKKIDEYYLENFSRLDNSETTTAILGD